MLGFNLTLLELFPRIKLVSISCRKILEEVGGVVRIMHQCQRHSVTTSRGSGPTLFPIRPEFSGTSRTIDLDTNMTMIIHTQLNMGDG